MRTYIFAYGTLRTGGSNHSVAKMNICAKSLGVIEMPGYKMYRVKNNEMGSSDYPGIVPTGLASDIVVGEVFEIQGEAAAQTKFISDLDAFENDADFNEYLRVEKHILNKQCYLHEYILPIVGLPLILSGDWVNSKGSTI